MNKWKPQDLDELRDDVREGVKEQFALIQDLAERCHRITDAGTLIPLDILLKRLLPKVEAKLEAVLKGIKRMEVDPFSCLEWPEENTCDTLEFDEDGVVIDGTDCQEQPTVVGCLCGDNRAVSLRCDKHMKRDKDWDWRWSAPLPLIEDLLKEEENE